eukprot:TRINITY_DN1861_c0_g1_i1.p1 TRINITY_DN1861_c0_g1~~TRINITY_DN1861_c0_g1_i1.p1  ORF type:complete len:585 (+),score=153.38 TRINITY_DN1861_c0_g1_i1:368-2122(+)
MHLLRRMVSKNVTNTNNAVKEDEVVAASTLFANTTTTTTTNSSTTTRLAAWTIPNSPVPYPENTNQANEVDPLLMSGSGLFCKPQCAVSKLEGHSASRLPTAITSIQLGELEEDIILCNSSTFNNNSTSTEHQFHLFFQLPCELQLYVLQFVNSGDIHSVQLSCKAIHTITLDNFLWKAWTSRHFNIEDQILHSYGQEVRDQWHQYYKTQTLLFNNGEIVSERIIHAENRPKTRFAQTGSVVQNKIYYIGGQMADKRSDEIISFDPLSNTFNTIPISNFSSTRTFTQNSTEITGDCRNFKGIDGKVPNFARHQAVSINDKIYVFGGYDYHYFYNLAIFDPLLSTWTYPNVNGDIPAPRSNHSSAVVGHCFYIFGGSIGDNVDKYSVTNDFYSFNTKTLTWTKIESKPGKTTPTARVGHVMTSLGARIFMFGGGVWGKTTGWTDQYNDLYEYDTKKEEWEMVEMKEEEKPMVCTYPYVCSVGQNVVLFGGASMKGSSVTNKMYVWDVMRKKWKEMEIGGKGGVDEISARSIGTANRVGENEVVVWGGYCGGLLEEDNDLFKFKLQLKERKNRAVGNGEEEMKGAS